MIARRKFLKGVGCGLAVIGLGIEGRSRAQERAIPLEELERLEQTSGGRLGVSVIDSADGSRWGRREGERFPMCSTFKFLLASAVLREVDAGRLGLGRRLPIAESDPVGHSPITRRHVGARGMTVRQLCEATMTESDNGAANLLLPLVGGPSGLTAFVRGIGDPETRCDRTEPALNDFVVGDPRDTTTPAAMADDLRRLVLGDVLADRSRHQLADWLVRNRTGGNRIRAGLPRGIRVGDKTGSNGVDTSNDVAVLWPPRRRAPVILTVYLQGATVGTDAQNATIASVARIVAGTLGR